MFYSSNQVNNLLNCKYCDGRLDKPRSLQCGYSICSHCVSYIQINKDKEFVCIVCNDKHEMPKTGLPLNKTVLEMLSVKSFDVPCGSAFEQLQETLKQVEKNKFELKNYINNGNDCVKEYCVELKSKVQLTTEQVIDQINQLSGHVIDEIDEYEQEIIDLNKNNAESLKRFETTEQELDSFQLNANKYLESNNFNEKTLIKLNLNAKILREKAKSEIKSIKNLIFNRRFLNFEASEQTFDNQMLGELVLADGNHSCQIFHGNKFEDLMKLCEFSADKKWSLIYKASKHGFEACDFHTLCADKPNTLVVIKSRNGNVFGGYTEQSWYNTLIQRSWYNSIPLKEFNDKPDSKAFIFSLINKEKKPLKIKCSSNQGIRCNNSCGPIFGENDFVIADNSNTNYNSFSNFGHCYSHPDYEYKSDKANSFLAGSYKFKVSEIEVYTTIN